MTAAFSMSGTLRLVPQLTDELSTTTVVDSATVQLSFPLANGTGSNQANGFYKDVITIAASGTANVNLRALPLNVMGGSGTLALASVKALVIRNRSTAATLSVGVSTSNRWTALASSAVSLAAGGVWLLTNFGSGYAVTTSDRVLAITNTGAASADVEIYVVGVQA
jgi:hypothetical protein